MPPPKKEVPRGAGSIDPDFTSQVEVQQAGPVAVVQETPFERLERSLASIGSGLAGAAQSLSQQQASLARLKDQAVARQERIIGSARAGQFARNASLQKRRLQDVQNRQQELLLRADQHDPEWLFRQSRIGFNNSASAEEQAMWSELLLGSRKLADKFKSDEEKERQNSIVQQFAMAGQTATVAVSEMVSNLQADVETQRELIGDGVGIHQRVQDWVLSEAAAASPEIFDIDPRDKDRELKEEQRDQLIAELVEKSLRVGDGLVRMHTDQTESTSFQTGVDLLSAQLLSYFEGKLGIDALSDSINDIGRLHFNHLPDTERDLKFKQFLADAIEAATAGQFGQDVGDIEERVAALIETGEAVTITQPDGSQTIVVKGLFNAIEMANLRNASAERLSSMAVQNYVSLVQRSQLLRTVEVPLLSDDDTIQRRSVPDPNASTTLAIPGDLDGRSEYDRIADQAIIEAELDIDPEEMSPVQLAAVSRIREMAAELNANGQKALSKAVQVQNNIRGVLDGDPQASASGAHDNMLITRAFSNSTQLSPHQLRAILEQDKLIRERNRATMPQGMVMEPESRQVWDGTTPLQRTPETRTLREAVYQLEAAIWNKSETLNAHALPNNLLGEMKIQWQQGNPEAMMDVVFFTSRLNVVRQDQIYAAFGHASKEALSLRTAVHNYKLAANNIEFKMPVEDLMDQARQRMATTSPTEFLDSPTPFTDFAGQQSRDVASLAFSEVLAVEGLDTQSEGGGLLSIVLPQSLGIGRKRSSENHRERMTFLQAAFLGPSKDIVDRMFGLWSIRVQRTDDDPVQAAQWVFGQFRDQGFRIVNFDGEVTLIQDPFGHFGPDEPRERGRGDDDRRILLGVATGNLREDDVPIETFNERVAAYVESPLAPWQRDVIQRALQLVPSETPRTMAEVYVRVPNLVNPDFFRDDFGNLLEGIKFVVSDGTNRDAQLTLRKMAADFGGVIIQPMTFDGRLVPVARARQDVEWIGIDGETHLIKRGEPLTVFSDQLFDSVVRDAELPPAHSTFTSDAAMPSFN